MPFLTKFNEQRIVEWNKKYINLEALQVPRAPR